MRPPANPEAPQDPRFGGRKQRGLWRRFRRFVQDHPTPLMWSWRIHEVALKTLRRPFEAVGTDRASRWVKPVEEIIKKPFFDCRMCGQCVLHITGMTCPMTCPKQLRNGPCGGVRMNGNCEVVPEMSCVWVDAYRRSEKMEGQADMGLLNPPVDWRLQGAASWVTFAIGRDEISSGSGAGPINVSEVVAP